MNRIARENGGNRAFGLPGYEKSRDFVLERVARFSTIDSWVQPFPGWFSETYNITLDVDTFGAVNVTTFTGAAGTPDRKPLTAPLIALPVNDVNGTGCTASDYNGVAVSGKIVIVKRGICAFGIKSSLARKSGAAGVLIWNNVQTPVFGSLGQQSDYAPTGLISLTDGQAIIGKLEAGQNLQATLWIDAVSEYRESWNVIAETKGGDPDNVVVVSSCETQPAHEI